MAPLPARSFPGPLPLTFSLTVLGPGQISVSTATWESGTIMLIGVGFLGWEEFGVFGQRFSDGSILKVGLRIQSVVARIRG